MFSYLRSHYLAQRLFSFDVVIYFSTYPFHFSPFSLKLRVDVQSRLIVSLLFMMDSERQSQSIDKPMVRRLLRMMSSIGFYTDKFETPFLLESQRYYSSSFFAIFFGA